MRLSSKVLPSQRGNLGIIELNNPKAFHALTVDMIHCLQDVLGNWYSTDNHNGDDHVNAILVKSSQQNLKRPAFCAGGDVKHVYQSGMNDLSKKKVLGVGTPGFETADFFR